MNIFPDDYGRNNNITANKITPPKLLKDYDINFETGQIIEDEKGHNIIVEGLEAVKVRNWLALNIQRNRFLIYMDVGNEVKSLYGKDLAYINKNIKAILEEALIDEYTTSILNIVVAADGDNYTVDFTVITIYGSYTTKESW
jgi:hypothetical protein